MEILGDKYRYESDLGRSAFARVVVATHLALQRRVALKILTQGAPPDVASRFLREARLVARLANDHIVKVLDAGELEPGVPYIAMELLEGTPLAALLRARGKLPVREACSYVTQACEGLAEAHAHGMVHRDVKTSNLFLAEGKRGSIVKVIDFGVTKADPSSRVSTAHMTGENALLGTPSWMAPEQLMSSHDVDPRADIWGLGVVLYALITGTMPFEGGTLRELLRAILEKPMRPIDVALPHGLVAVVERCLRKKPDERYASVRELSTALAPFAEEAAPSRARTRIVAIAVAVASAGAGAAVVLAHGHRAKPAEPSSSALVTSPASASVEVAFAASARVEPDRTAQSDASAAPARPSRPRPSSPVWTIAKTNSVPDGEQLPKEVWAFGFERDFVKAFCKMSSIQRCYSTSPEECEVVATSVTKACIHNVMPTLPTNMHDQAAAGVAGVQVSHCVVPEFRKRMVAQGKALAADACD